VRVCVKDAHLCVRLCACLWERESLHVCNFACVYVCVCVSWYACMRDSVSFQIISSLSLCLFISLFLSVFFN